MSTQIQRPLPTSLGQLFQRAWTFNRLLTLTIALSILLIPFALLGMLIDPKVITGVNGWIKPLKFMISIAIYCATFLWLLTFVQGRRRWVQTAANVTAITLLIELVLITLQTVRGTTSHYNIATPFDTTVYSVMGTAIMVLATMNLVLAILLLIQRLDDRILAWALRLGVIASLVGIAMGPLMTSKITPEQLAVAQTGEPMTTAGAHSVGVPDGGPGLPVVGWSTVGGDLRVPHFVGLHGMQIIPLLGLWLASPAMRRRFGAGQRLALVWTGGVAYVAVTLILMWQALRGQSVIAPDALTLAAFGAVLAVLAIVALTITARQPQQELAASSRHL
jgi:hypothetical protein